MLSSRTKIENVFPSARVQCIDLALWRPWVVVVDEKGKLDIWDRETNGHVLSMNLEKVDEIRQEAEAYNDAARHTFSLPVGQRQVSKPQKTGKVRQVRFYDPVISETQFGSALASQNAEWVVVALANRLVVLDLQLGSSADKRFRDFKPESTDGRSVQTFDFYPSNTLESPLIACGAADGVVRLLDSTRHSVVKKLAGAHSKAISAISVLPIGLDSPLLASGSLDGSLVMWDVAAGRALYTLSNVVNEAPVHRICTVPSVCDSVLLYGFDGGLLGNGGSIALLSGLKSQPKVENCTKLAASVREKEFTGMAACSHATFDHPVIGLMAAEKDEGLSLLRVDQSKPTPCGFIDLAGAFGPDQRSTVHCLATHSLIDGIFAVGTSSGTVLVTHDLLSAPQLMVPHAVGESVEILFIKGNAVFCHTVNRAQVLLSQQQLDAKSQPGVKLPVATTQQAFTLPALPNGLFDRCCAYATGNSQWAAVGSSRSEAWGLYRQTSSWVNVTTENCSDMVFGSLESHALCYATLKSDSVVVKAISNDGAPASVRCTKTISGATRLFGGPMLCVSRGNSAPPVSQFYSCDDLSVLPLEMPAADLVEWDGTGAYCALITCSYLHVLRAQDGVLKLLHSLHTHVVSLFWFSGTLFYATSTEVFALVIHSPEPTPIELANLSGRHERLSGPSTHPIQRRPRGAIAIAGVIGEALALLDTHAQLHAISLAHPFTKVTANHCVNHFEKSHFVCRR